MIPQNGFHKALWPVNQAQSNSEFKNFEGLLIFLLTFKLWLSHAIITIDKNQIRLQMRLKMRFFAKLMLKPQDSFGEFDNFFLDLQKVQGIIRKHH